ncbi:hypothetical protein lacNasYZ03_07240 [Lactobacillus nasalidis]|uniref:Tetratricopeptide repeat protein n=1 Tax=Lactobacillus nasalidis TaxID=2797258 RepID=A0ABQ3W847_9LACO|nr:tetratricopeptide repeat protein [Lactobacillus nasalidis]GHV98216.1 hypothetical protein lacNasYZ01_13980 [Lactobacillus nasalidis]GHV99886.1 hypothetical protein lacNasYZ02_13160 [Lactobacillus nasalidis]GHW01037.1 hypothetical protein lacNasYZ03_07240 [Lactobacillus nasalidis]
MDQKINQLYEAGKVNEAIHALIGKIDQAPKQTDNYLQLATYLLDQGSAEQAQELLTKAQGLVDDPQDLTYDLAVCDYALGNFDQALARLAQIPDDDLTMYQKALVYLKLGQSSKALAYALSIKQTDDRVRELIGDIWLALGDLQAAKASYLQIPAAQRTSKLNFLLGLTCFSSDREKAESFFAKSKAQDAKYYQKAKDQYESLLKLLSQQKGQDRQGEPK